MTALVLMFFFLLTIRAWGCTYEWVKKISTIVHLRTTETRGDRGAVLFSFEHKSRSNREIKKHAVWFGSVDF